MNNNTLKISGTENFCCMASRICVYLYSLVFFLRAIISFPSRLDGVLRFGIAVFGILGFITGNTFDLRRIHISKFFIWYIGMFGISLFSSLYSLSNDAITFTNNIFDILFIGTCFSISIKDEMYIKKYLFFFSICGGVIFLILMSRNLLYIDDRLGRSLTGDNTNSFAMFLMLTLFAAIGSIYLNDSKIIKIICVIISFIDLYMLMLSGGRKYVLVPVVLVIAISIMQTMGAKNIIKRLAIIIIITIGIISVWEYMLKNPVLYNSIGYRFINRVSVSNRELYIKKGFEFFLNSPIWGHGENSFSILIVPYHGSQIYSHNNFIELLTNFGIIGFIWFYYFYGKTLNCNLKYAIKTRDKLSILSTSLMISMLILDLGTISYSDTSLLFTFWVLCFNVAYGINPTKQKDESESSIKMLNER